TSATEPSTTRPPNACSHVIGSSCSGHATAIATTFAPSSAGDERDAGTYPWTQLISTWLTTPTTIATNARYSQSLPAISRKSSADDVISATGITVSAAKNVAPAIHSIGSIGLVALARR